MTSLRELVESARATLPEAPCARWGTLLFSLSVLTFVISLAASEAFLFAAALSTAIHQLRAAAPEARPPSPAANALRFPFPPVRMAVGCFCLLTILSVFGAANSAAGWPAVRKLVLFIVMLLSVGLAGAPGLQELLYTGLFFASTVAGAVGVFQFAAEYRTVKAAHPGEVYTYMSVSRIHGFMGHWMNFGGQQMLVFCLLLAYLLFSPPRGMGRIHGHEPESRPQGEVKLGWLAFGVIALSIALNFTRGVWLGCFVAVVYLVGRRRPRWLLVLPLLIGLAILAGPSLLRERMESLLHPTHDPSIAIRLEMWQVAVRVIRAHPWLGVGPNNIGRDYLLYLARAKSPVVGYHEHFHNNLLQIGAERGLACLAAWLWMMVALLWGLLRLRRPSADRPRDPSPDGLRQGTPQWIIEGAIAAWLAFISEGFFEFNFGTSPVLMVFLFVVSVPFARPGRHE